ncbi:MAG: serine hydrolase domain-containing protein [Hellea sp.]
MKRKNYESPTLLLMMCFCLCCSLLIGCEYQAHCSDSTTTYHSNIQLRLEQPITANLKGDVQHSFGLELKADQLAVIRFERGDVGTDSEINLRMEAVNPRGDIIEATNTGSGVSLMVLKTYTSGNFQVKVRGWDDQQDGSYVVHLDKLKDLPENQTDQMDLLLEHFYSTERPGGMVAIIDQGKPVYKRAFGMANLDENLPFDLSASTEIASVSKQFTAFAIALLIADGKLTPSTSVRSIIPEFPDMGTPITIHHLVHHLSGLQNYEAILRKEQMNHVASDALTYDKIWEAILSTTQTNFVPGTQHEYSNSGYVVLTKIIERTTSVPFPQWMHENIFVPLEMKDSYIWTIEGSDTNQFAASYAAPPNYVDKINVPRKIYQQQSKSLEALGAAHVHTTLDDLIKWSNNYRTGQLGGQAVLDIIKSGINDTPQPWDYLYGLKQYDHHGFRRQAHEGLTQGYRTLYARFPDIGVDFIYLTNDGEWRTYYLAEKIIELYLEDTLETTHSAVEPIKNGP